MEMINNPPLGRLMTRYDDFALGGWVNYILLWIQVMFDRWVGRSILHNSSNFWASETLPNNVFSF